LLDTYVRDQKYARDTRTRMKKAHIVCVRAMGTILMRDRNIRREFGGACARFAGRVLVEKYKETIRE